MPKVSHEVTLTPEEREKLKALTHKGSGQSAKTIMHANILLMTDASLGEKKKNIRDVAELFDISPTTVNQVRKLYSESGLELNLSHIFMKYVKIRKWKIKTINQKMILKA
jgi:hypothetical protein